MIFNNLQESRFIHKLFLKIENVEIVKQTLFLYNIVENAFSHFWHEL